MAKALRKTLRKKHSRRSHIFGWIIVVLGLLLSVSAMRENGFTGSTAVTWIALLVLVLVTVWEDWLNGFIAGKRMLAGTSKSTAVFRDDGFVSETELGKTEWKYEKVIQIAELPAYFVFVYSKNHAQVYDKATLSGGTADAFRTFITEKTGKTIQSIK